MSDVTEILSAVERGDQAAAEKLLPLVYDELRKLAASKLSQEKPGQTLQPTALVHEAYLRIVGSEDSLQWNGRAHFFGAAAEAMRRILVENARRKNRVVHGGDVQKHSLRDVGTVMELPAGIDDQRLLLLDAALSRLSEHRPEIGQLVKLRYFGGLSAEQSANALKISLRTATRNWAYAKAWLRREMDRLELED